MPKSFELSRVTKGILIAAIVSIVLTILLSLIYFFTSLQESLIYSFIIAGISVFAASFYVAVQTGTKGFFYGLTIGLGFFLFSIIIYYIFYDGNPSWKIVLEKFIFSIIPGTIGGTIGAILKR